MSGNRALAVLATMALLASCDAGTRAATPDIEVLAAFPTQELTTSGNGLTAPPCRPGCSWPGKLTVEISTFPPTPMARAVADTTRLAKAGGLTHLAWLRINGHYAIEQIESAGPARACTLILDDGSPRAIRILVHGACPAARKVAQSLLQPTFQERMRQNPTSAGQYFCQAFPCAIHDPATTIRISTAHMTLVEAADPVFAGIRRHRTTIHGRAAVTREPTAHGHQHRFYLAIPNYPEHVIVADITTATPTRALLDGLTHTLVTLSTPSG